MSMMMLMGTKLGMTRVFTAEGNSVPVTAIALGPCVVTQIRTVETDGYSAVQIAYEDVKARRSSQSVIAHDAKAGTSPKRYHREFRCDAAVAATFTVGQILTASEFANHAYVDVTGVSKGKGFQGVMKRHNFKGLFATHGTERKHRSPGSIGGLCSNRGFGGGLKKGKRMAGHMGDERVTCRSLDVLRVDGEQNLILVKGGVPGSARKMVMVRTAVRLYKTKSKNQAAKLKAGT